MKSQNKNYKNKKLKMIRLLVIASVLLTSCQLFTPAEPVIARLVEHNIGTSTGTVQGQSIAQAIAQSVSNKTASSEAESAGNSG